jgi:hypothetical protein
VHLAQRVPDDEDRFAGKIPDEIVARTGDLLGPADGTQPPNQIRSRSSSQLAVAV